MLPERINVMKVISYDVEQIVDDLVEHFGSCENPSAHDRIVTRDNITIEDCLNWISDWVIEDFGTDDVIYQDENGNEL